MMMNILHPGLFRYVFTLVFDLLYLLVGWFLCLGGRDRLTDLRHMICVSKVDVCVMCNFAVKKSQMIYYHTKTIR